MIIGDLNKLTSTEDKFVNNNGNSIRHILKNILGCNDLIDIGLPYTIEHI